MKRIPRLWLIAALGCAALAGVWGVLVWYRGTDASTSVAIPDPDTSGFHPRVADRIRQRRAAVAEHPANAYAWGRLGMAFDIHNLVEDAVVCYTRAERLDPADFRWPYHRAVSMPAAPPDEIIAALERAASIRPDYVPCLIRLGLECLRADDAGKARTWFDKALSAEPDNPHAQIGLAQIEFAAGSHDSARARLERILQERSDHGEALRLLARLYHARGDLDRARRLTESAARLPSKTALHDPARTEVVFEGATARHLISQAGRLREQGKPRDAVTRLRLVLEEQPDDADAHLLLGLALFFGLGQLQEGLSELREAVRLAPTNPHARQALDAATLRMNLQTPP